MKKVNLSKMMMKVLFILKLRSKMKNLIKNMIIISFIILITPVINSLYSGMMATICQKPFQPLMEETNLRP